MADDIAGRKPPHVRPKEDDHRAGDLKPLSRKQKVNEVLSAELARRLRLDAKEASESTGVLHVERREVPGEKLAKSLLLPAKSVGENKEVAYLGQREEEGEKPPLWLKESFSDGGETP